LGGALFVGIGAYKYMQSHRAERLPHRLRQLTERFQ
jgi:hypothetical protein